MPHGTGGKTMRAIERRLHKLEGVRDRNDVGTEVDRFLEKAGTSRAALLADFGSLIAFRDWLKARIAAADHQDEAPIASHHRQWQGDRAVSAKWNAILDHQDVLQPAAPSA